MRVQKNISLQIFAGIFILFFTCCATSSSTGKKTYTKETEALLARLNTLSQKGIMIGQQEALAFGTTWMHEEDRSDIKEVCGDYPAVFGWDIGVIEIRGKSGWPYPIRIDSVKYYIQKVHRMGGINTVTAHINNPATGESTWDKTPAVHTILPEGENHKLYTDWLDKAADFFLNLKDDNDKLIPIIFRPYHEHNGNWFWWGKGNSSADDFKALWIFTVDYLRKEKGVNNLLYSFSTDKFRTEEEYMERFPGNDYVDMIGFDIYNHPNNETNEKFIAFTKNCLSILSNISEKTGFPYAITEIGSKNVTDSTFWTGVLYPIIKDFDLSHVLIWRNKILPDDFYAPYPGQASAPDFIEFKNKPGILFLQDIK